MSENILSMLHAASVDGAKAGYSALELKPEHRFYRKYTEGMLRRYLRCSMESGRVPSLMGREMFRSRVTQYKIRGFDDAVNFVQDVRRCLGKLQPLDRALLERIAIQEHTQGHAAALLHLSLRTTVRRYGTALDRLTAQFLQVGLLEPFLECEESEAVEEWADLLDEEAELSR